MHYFEYRDMVQHLELSDYSTLLNIARKFKKIDKTTIEGAVRLKIAIIGSTSIQLIVSVFKAILCKYNIYADIYEGEYNGIEMDVFDDNSSLYSFMPSYVLIIPDFRDVIERKPAMLSDFSQVEKCVNDTVDYYNRICTKVHQVLPGSQILLANFVEPIEDALGILGSNYLFSQSLFFRMINMGLVRNRDKNTFIIDIEKLASSVGKLNWFNPSAYYLNKSGFALEYIGYFCDAFARPFEAFIGKVRKCLVLDLDNTLWGGVVGDAGYDGINLDPNDAEGEAFLAFQKYVLELKKRGVLLAVCSKNDYDNAIEPFIKNEHMVLTKDDITLFVANWNDKASNIRRIADELNIGLDSLVFFDDNPTERELIRQMLPVVTVVEVPEDPAQYINSLYSSNCFDWTQITEEDLNRAKTYSDNKDRKELLNLCSNYDEYLEKLEMVATFEQISDKTLERFVQLTNKSNQFNLRTQRYSEAEICQMMENPEYGLFTISLKDCFTNYGVIACVVIKFTKKRCIIENWVMSCRVLKKTVENFTISRVVSLASTRGYDCIVGEYVPSKKNNMVCGLYADFGFETIEHRNDGSVVYKLENLGNHVGTYKYAIKED